MQKENIKQEEIDLSSLVILNDRPMKGNSWQTWN
ncbi:hypothetical protein CDA64_01662 [Lactobacillus helveticus]|nr:hypothetical protein CDA64_01662 [Lactobacillus helveticus]